jgi:hypothetical protein
MQDFVDEGFVRSHTVAFGEPRDGQITIAGEIKCEGGIAIQVDKTLLILDGEGDAATVRTVDYRYHAYVEGRGSLFRYCSPHGDGHRPYHHVHRFEIPTLAAIVPVEEIRDGNAVPTLGDVLEEARDLKYSFDFWPATGEEE